MVRIVTDSTSDLPAALVEEYQIRVVPLKVMFGTESFLDGLDLTPDEFYVKLREASALPTTSQPAPGEFEAVYRELSADGSPVISLHLSGGLSGTYQSARLGASAAEPADISVFDTKSATSGLGMIVVEAAKAALAGATKDQIVTLVQQCIAHNHVLLMVDTLEYLQKGGRIGRAQAFLGSLMNIKPILVLVDGIVTPLEKVRGRAKGLIRMAELGAERVKPGERVMVSIGHAQDPAGAAQLAEKVKAVFPNLESVQIREVGPVIGTHVGPGTLGLLIQGIHHR